MRQGSDQRLFALVGRPLSARETALLVGFCTACTMAWAVLMNRMMSVAWQLPDVNFYMLQAGGHSEIVPAPFSARLLHPWLARGVASALHAQLTTGFTVLDVVSLLWMMAVVFFLLVQRQVPRWLLVAVGAVPLWPSLMGFAGLPDPLYGALIATLLLALESGWLWAAAMLMFPLMLARESTSLTLVCLLLVAGRRLGWLRSGVAVACVALASLLVRHVSRGSLTNPEQLGGGLYMMGKVISNSLRSVGLVPWSNVYPELCRVPVWQTGLHLGRVESVGLCPWSPLAFAELIWAFLCTFGVLPVLLVAGRGRWRQVWAESSSMLRFCLVYGGISFLLGPALGTWYSRLMGYGWPLLLVAVPVIVAESPGMRSAAGLRRCWLLGVVLVLHLLICAVGEGEQFPLLGLMLVAEGAVLALLLGQTAGQRERAKPA